MFGKKKPESGGPPAFNEAERKAISKDDREAFKELEDLTPLLLASLDSKIRNGRIGTVVGIDVSGRLPALLMSQCIQRLQQKSGHAKPLTRFFRGRLPESAIPDLRQAIRNMKLDKDRIVLIVDDTYNKGTSVIPIRTAFLEEGYEVEVAVYLSTEPAKMQQAIGPSHYGAANEILGQDPDGRNRRYKSPGIYMKRMLAGTYKDETSDSVYAVPLRKRIKHPEAAPSVTGARKLLNETANNVIKRYERILTTGE